MMVDWVQGFVETGLMPPGEPLYDTGRVLRLARGGEVESEHSGSMLLEGSHDSRLLVRSYRGCDLLISGNVVKHVQGHNLFGPADPVGLFFDAGIRVRMALGLFPSPQTWDALEFEGPRFTRLDLTRSYRFPTAPQARSWIRHVAGAARSRHGGALLHGDTVYLGKGSERWSFKVYHKADELLARGKLHKLPRDLPGRDRLIEWSQGVVRFELTLRAKELEKIDLQSTPVLDVWTSYYQRITWNQNAMATSPDLVEQQLPAHLRMTVGAWRGGADVRSILSKPSFYRQRRQILDALGVDIASPPAQSGEDPLSAAELDSRGWDPEPLHAYPGHLERKQGYLLR